MSWCNVILCRELGIGIVPYSPLGRGFFGGKAVAESVPSNSFVVDVLCYLFCLICCGRTEKFSWLHSNSFLLKKNYTSNWISFLFSVLVIPSSVCRRELGEEQDYLQSNGKPCSKAPMPYLSTSISMGSSPRRWCCTYPRLVIISIFVLNIWILRVLVHCPFHLLCS